MDYDNLDPQPDPDEHCTVCTSLIVTMAFRGTGVCSDNCRRVQARERVATDTSVT